jgi:hypothetical protein
MSKRTEDAYSDLVTWWENNYGRNGVEDPNQRWFFTIKALTNVIRLQAMMIEDLRKAEGRSPVLFTPNGVKVSL